MRWLALLLFSGCAPHYDWVEEPEAPAASPEDTPTKSARDWQCAGSSGAVRQQARQGRYQGVEGFDSRGCIGPERFDEP